MSVSFGQADRCVNTTAYNFGEQTVQVMIDLSAETPAALRLAARFLIEHANLVEGLPAGFDTSVPTGTPEAPPAPLAPSAPAAPVQAVAPSATILPFVPPAPPATPAAPVTGLAPPSAPPAPTMTPTAASPAMMTTAGINDIYDSGGMPWDARIHQSGKSQKKDQTWKLKKNLDPNVVEAVTRELHAAGRIRNVHTATPTVPSVDPAAAAVFGQTPLPAGASAPVTLPQTSAVPQAPGQGPAVPIPPVVPVAPPQGYQAPAVPQAPGTQAAPQASVTPQSSPLHVPPAPVLGVPVADNSAMVPPVTDYRSLVTKLAISRNAGKITAQEIDSIVMQAGAPSLQLLGSMLHLVPTVDSLLDAILLTR